MQKTEGIRYLDISDSAEIKYIFAAGDSPPDKGKPEVDTT